jgi:hypothetical protein
MTTSELCVTDHPLVRECAVLALEMADRRKERIRCGVTNHALEVFESDFDRGTDDPLTTFK